MTSRALSPRRLHSQNSVKKQENGMDSPLHPERQPLRAIPEASSSRSSSASETTETSSPSRPPTPRGKKRAAAVYRQSENVDGNIGSASNTPEKPREKRTALTRVSKATAPWSSKLPITASLARALQESLQQTDAANKSWDTDSVGGTPTTSYRTPLIPSTGVGKPGSVEPTSRTFKISGKPPLDSEISRTCFGSSNSSFLQSTPNRSVNRSLRYGATPGSAASVGSSRAPAYGANFSESFQFNSGQQIVAQQFDLEEDTMFWEDHNVQVILRTRPINASESALKGFSRCLRQENSHSITWIGQPETRFTFDHVAGEHITQENLFRVAGVPMVENCMAGYNSCMFCYGQTGSGKTHTMLGDIVDLEQRPSDDRGITPRVFEYLFSKIHEEEESRTDEHLKYVCKCSFLEIFNEQITDLLEPSSTNLQVREGGKKGVYVENLTEVAVGSVQDVVHLLLLGAANRKVAATNMNRESSRSHSVFTCTIESKWELNSATNIRFGRLNLVDLAGSERQKTSGAEGERLKEAANINKSLSTLGLVIMILVDVANGKPRHVPYRDSKLTYLLQDSLGGNSKTTMIANISPSSCCALETLSTLKFAQRAKFIRNNAVVNEDASGDVNGLRQEIQELKDELDRIRRQDLPRTPSMHSVVSVAQDSLRTGDNNLGMAVIAFDEQEHSRCSLDSWEFSKVFSAPRFSNKKLEAMEAVLAGALRREQEAELSQKRQSAEIEQLTRLVKQREGDSQCSKMLLRFREDKIRRLEALSAGSMSADVYLRQENDFLMNELRLIHEKAERNPELTRFAMENIRLLEQLRRFQDFYTGGEREAMADEISSLRDQLLEVLDRKLSLTALTSPQREALAPELAASQREIELLRIETDNYRREVEDCRKNLSSMLEANSRISKQLEESNAELQEVKLKDQAHQTELQNLREQALDAEAIEWGHAQHLELISNLKIKLQQSEDRADREANLRFYLNEKLSACLGEAAGLQADLQEARGAFDAADMLVSRLQSAESDLLVAQEMAILAQNAVRQIHLETKEIAEDQRLYLKNTEDTVGAACMKELELREELKEAQSLIQKLSSAKDEPMCSSCSVASENEQERDITINKRTAGISQLEQDLTSLNLSFGSGCTHLNTESKESAEGGIESIVKLFDVTSATQKRQLNFNLEENQTVEDRTLLEVESDMTRKDLQDADSIVYDPKGDRDLYVLEGNNKNPVDLELVQATRCLQDEIMKLKPQVISDQQRETVTKLSTTELVKELQSLVLVVQAVLEERKIKDLLKEKDFATKAREERDATTSKLLEHLREGENALADAVHEMQGILDDCLSQPTALNKGRLQEQEQQLDMTTTPTGRKDTVKRKHTGGFEHSDGFMRNFAVCTTMLKWFSDTLTSKSSAKNSLISQIDRVEEDLGNKDCAIKKMEEDIIVLQRDWTEAESKAVKAHEKLRESTYLMKELARSEEQLKIQTVALVAENKRLTRCMACREIEFSSLHGHIEGLEKSLKESDEKERISAMTLGNLRESLKVLEKQWHVEREQMKDRIVAANQELSESLEMKQSFYNALKELEDELFVTENKCQATISELETQWSIARGDMSRHLTQISLDFAEVKSCAEKTYRDLAKARSLLSAADTAMEQLVGISSALKDANNQFLEKQEALRSELSRWEQYSVELLKSSSFVPSPCKDSNASADAGVTSFYNYFETLKKEVEKGRRECERLRAEVSDKDSTLFSVQLELSASIASSREGEIELACVADERNDLKLQLTTISKALENAHDEVRCRDVELKTFECELHKVMDALVRTEEKMDESSLEWRKQIEKLKAEMEDAKLFASEKSTEAILLRKQFEDGQATLKEAEILVNALVRANENAKLDVLKWKSREEKITLQSSEAVRLIDVELSVTMDHVEEQLQDLSADIHGMKTLLTGICSEIAAGFVHEFKEFMNIQMSEIQSATDGAHMTHMTVAKMNAKVTDLEPRMQQIVMENEALEVSLDRTQDLLVGSQAALEDAMQNMGVQHKEFTTTRDELQGALASSAGKSAYISELTFECDHLSTRIQELERLFTEMSEELTNNVANSKKLEMEKLTLVEATDLLQVQNNHLHGQVKQLEMSLADSMRLKQVVEMEVVSLRQQKYSCKDEIRKFEVDLAASRDAVNAAAVKLLETEVTIHTLVSDLENCRNEVVCIQGSLDEAVTEVNDLRLLTHVLNEKEVHLMALGERQKNVLKCTSEKFVQSEAEFHEAVDILATMLESTSCELHAAEALKADLEKDNIKFSSLLASLQVTVSQLGQEKGFLSERVSVLEEDKKNLLERLETLSMQLCAQSLEASAASSAQELQLEVLKTIIESISRDFQEKSQTMMSLQEELDQSSARCLALDESKNELLERLEDQSLELCKQSQAASAASTAHQTELEILKTIIESISKELQDKSQTMMSLQEELDQSSARCLALNENKNNLLERLENQSLELCKQSQAASAASTAHQTELEMLKTFIESISKELQEKDHVVLILQGELDQSSARYLALDENKNDLLERLENQNLELCKQSQAASAASTAHQTELESLKTIIGSISKELQEKDHVVFILQGELDQSSARCLALDENKNELLERLENQSLELRKQSQAASAASITHQTELEMLKTFIESISKELQDKSQTMMSLQGELDQSSARCLALDENKNDLLERLEDQNLELCKQSQAASAASTAHQTELESLKTIIGSISKELQDKSQTMMSLQGELDQSSARCLALDENKNELLERLEDQSLELCKQSQAASAASTAHQTELEMLKTFIESISKELQDKSQTMMSLQGELDQSSARCLALDENKNDPLERLEDQNLELCKQSQAASAASTAHQTELESLKTIIGSISKELQEKDHVVFILQGELDQSSARCLALDENKNELLERLENQSLELRKQSQAASAASITHQTELEMLKTFIESISKELQDKSQTMMSLQGELDQSSARCLALDENKNDPLERLEDQNLELCKQSQAASAASTAHQTELESLKTFIGSISKELQEKDHVVFILQGELDQSSARCLALDENKNELLERLENQSLELRKQSQAASAASITHQTELEMLKTFIESISKELQDKSQTMMSLQGELDQSSARCLALDENKNDLLERLEDQSLELRKQSQAAIAASITHQTELEMLKTFIESISKELQDKSQTMMSLQGELDQSSARCLALDENKNDLLERLEDQSLELRKQSQAAIAASITHQTELEMLKTFIESISKELQDKSQTMMSLQGELDQSSARCLALDENKNDLLERLEDQSLELRKQSQAAIAASITHQTELEMLKTFIESISKELQDKSQTMMSLQGELDQSSARCLALDENKNDLLERLENQNLELCKQSQAASAASTAHQTELESLKTIIGSISKELQEKDHVVFILQGELDQSSARCLALDENKNELLERLENQSLELCKQSQEANDAFMAQRLELDILNTIIESASTKLLEKDQISSSLRDNLQESSAETLKLLNSLEISVVASTQIERERDEILATANNLETEKRVLRDEVNTKSRNCADLEMKILWLQTEVQESSAASCKQELELEILTTMLESAIQESREKDAMASDLENLLSQSQLQNAEMLQSSQEVVNHFSLFQSQLDTCFQQNKELEKTKVALTGEIYSLSQELSEIKDLRQASEKCSEELRTSFAELEKQKDVEVRLLSDEVEKLKSQEAAMEVDLWDWEQRCQDAEVQLDDKVSELAVLRGKLVATQEECKQQLELVYEALRKCQRRTADMDSERRDLINEIEEGCSVVADLQAKLQIRESEMEEHFSRHSVEQETLESLENEKRVLESTMKHLLAEIDANQQRATAAENMQVETRLEMEALERDLNQKEELLQNLESDLNLLQESALQELRLNQELESLRVTTDALQQEVNMQKERRTRLETEIGQVTEEIVQTRNQAVTWKAKAYELETELDKKRQTIESLEDELRMAEQNMANTLEEVTVDLKEVESDRDRLQSEVLELTEQLEMTHTMADERDSVVAELHQAGELSRTYAKEKEDEARLLTRSVHELESTVYALENQLGLLKREAERQRLLREDMEMETQKLNNHIFVTQSALEESNARNAEELKDAMSSLQETERNVEDKESEMSHFRRKLENLEIASKDKDVQINDAMTQISDLLLAAEVQKADYQQKLARASQVERSKTVNCALQSGCTFPNSIEVATEISSFDAIPSQESFSRRDITHSSCQSRISELEELASSRQKEVFTLHGRLAEAESMTHDVLRDLLGVKSEMNNVVSMLDHQQIKQLAETACRKNVEAEKMETELSSLRSQLNAYVEERESWVEEINQRQCETVSARVAAENLRQNEQALTDELEKFRIENINHQEKISELEMEIRKLPSSQQSFYQQINHHAKIKEENQALKLSNEELSKELRRTELLHAGMHDELLRYRSAEPKSTSPSFDEERRNFRHLLQEAENGRAEAAQKLSSLCSALMQAAGFSVPETVDVPGAMDALGLLENRLKTTELERSDSKYKIKFTGERRRRTDVRAKDSPLRSISNFTDLLQRASSGSPAPR